MKYTYFYVTTDADEKIHQHILKSKRKLDIFEKIKEHWKSGNVVPMNLFFGTDCILDPQGFENMRTIGEMIE